MIILLFTNPLSFESQQPLGEVVHGIPDSEEADGKDSEENDDNVPRMDADGIGIDHEVALTGA